MAIYDTTSSRRWCSTDRHRRQIDHGHVDTANGIPANHHNSRLRDRMGHVPAGICSVNEDNRLVYEGPGLNGPDFFNGNFND